MAPEKRLPRKLPPGKLPSEKLSPLKFFCEFFLTSSFYFDENFRPSEKSIFIQLIVFLV